MGPRSWKNALPKKFQMKSFRDKSARDSITRLATPDEIALGLADAKGYYLSLNKRTSVYNSVPTTSTMPPPEKHEPRLLIPGQ